MTGTVIALILLLVRKLIKSKVSYRIVYGLWLILLVQLIVPYHLPSDISIYNYIDIPEFDWVIDDTIISSGDEIIVSVTADGIQDGTAREGSQSADDVSINDKIQTTNTNSLNHETQDSETTILNDEIKAENNQGLQFDSSRMNTAIEIIEIIWLSMMGLLLIALIVMQYRLSKALEEAIIYTKEEELIQQAKRRIGLRRNVDVYTSECINTPLVYGLIKPRVILPLFFVQTCSQDVLEQVMTHEFVHIKRFDYMIKPLALLLMVLHWFNPILWISYLTMQKDMEQSCDEVVVGAYDKDIRKEYAASLLMFASYQNNVKSSITLAFGENNVKSRVKGILNLKKKLTWISILVVILVVILAVMLLTGKSGNTNQTAMDNSVAIDTIDESAIDSIQVVKAAGNPIYGANSKIIVDEDELQALIKAFNEAQITGVVPEDQIKISDASIYYFYQGDEVVNQFGFNGNDSSRIWIDQICYYIEYSGETPYELYSESVSETIIVDDNLEFLVDIIPVATEEDISNYLDMIKGNGGYGAEPPKLLYEDDTIAIMDNLGIIIYDKTKEQITNVINAKDITQGNEKYPTIYFVSADGSSVYAKCWFDLDSDLFLSAYRYDREENTITAISEEVLTQAYDIRSEITFLEEEDTLSDLFGYGTSGNLYDISTDRITILQANATSLTNNDLEVIAEVTSQEAVKAICEAADMSTWKPVPFDEEYGAETAFYVSFNNGVMIQMLDDVAYGSVMNYHINDGMYEYSNWNGHFTFSDEFLELILDAMDEN